MKGSADEFISKNPILFSTTDIKQIKNVIDDPGETIRCINPHTINLIKKLKMMPYQFVI